MASIVSELMGAMDLDKDGVVNMCDFMAWSRLHSLEAVVEDYCRCGCLLVCVQECVCGGGGICMCVCILTCMSVRVCGRVRSCVPALVSA